MPPNRQQSSTLTSEDRETLRYYVATEGSEITAGFVFRFYIRRLWQWFCVSAGILLGIWLFVPVSPVLTLQTVAMLVVIAAYTTMFLLCLWTSCASVRHWRLLQRILDWDAVHRLHQGEQDMPDRNDVEDEE